MKRLFCLALATTFLALSAPADSSAQTSIFVGGGATIPVSDFSDFDGAGAGTDGANTGWQGTVGALFAVGEAGLAVGPRVYYGSNSHETTGDKTNLFGGTAVALYGFGDPEALNPYVFGEFGVMSHAFKSDAAPATDATSTAAVWGGGVGVGFPLGGVTGFVSAGYTAGLGDNSGTTYFALFAGATFAVGGG